MILPAHPFPERSRLTFETAGIPETEPCIEDRATLRSILPFSAAIGLLFGTLLGCIVTAELVHFGSLPLTDPHVLASGGFLAVTYAIAGCLVFAVMATIAILIGHLHPRLGAGSASLRSAVLGTATALLLIKIAIEPELGTRADFSIRHTLEWSGLLFLVGLSSLTLARVSFSYYKLRKNIATRPRRPWVAATVLVGVGGVGTLTWMHEAEGSTHGAPPLSETPILAASTPLGPIQTPLVLFGVEGLGDEIVLRIDKTQHPLLSQALDEGSRTTIRMTTDSAKSAWTTLLTGAPESEHGIPAWPGLVIEPWNEVIPGNPWMPSLVGLPLLVDLLEHLGVLSPEPTNLLFSKSRFLWEELRDNGIPSKESGLTRPRDSADPAPHGREAIFRFINHHPLDQLDSRELLDETEELLRRSKALQSDAMVVLVFLPRMTRDALQRRPGSGLRRGLLIVHGPHVESHMETTAVSLVAARATMIESLSKAIP